MPQPRQNRLGPYELLSSLGKGTAGTVFLARRAGDRRLYAVKLLRADAGSEDVLRFQREVRLAARLDHPGIVRCLEAGVDRVLERPYMVMDYVPGETLQQRIRRARPAPAEGASLLARVADAVAFAHAAGVVHRDLKPANVILHARDGFPRIVDFGLARDLGGGTWLTRQGDLLGTPYYMSPEQLRGEAACERTDVYALGVMLYELLCGQRPFAGGNVVELSRRIKAGDPEPPSCRDPAAPAELERVCLTAMALDREARFPSAAAFAEALRRASGPVPPPQRKA